MLLVTGPVAGRSQTKLVLIAGLTKHLCLFPLGPRGTFGRCSYANLTLLNPYNPCPSRALQVGTSMNVTRSQAHQNEWEGCTRGSGIKGNVLCFMAHLQIRLHQNCIVINNGTLIGVSKAMSQVNTKKVRPIHPSTIMPYMER